MKATDKVTKAAKTEVKVEAKVTIKAYVYGLLKAKGTKNLTNEELSTMAKKVFKKSAIKGWHISRYRYNMTHEV